MEEHWTQIDVLGMMQQMVTLPGDSGCRHAGDRHQAWGSGARANLLGISSADRWTSGSVTNPESQRHRG